VLRPVAVVVCRALYLLCGAASYFIVAAVWGCRVLFSAEVFLCCEVCPREGKPSSDLLSSALIPCLYGLDLPYVSSVLVTLSEGLPFG
jgi:hypothetical protein